MSGGIPRRVLNGRIGATIEKNQTPMQAGLAPRVGKSGASIRLYYSRVDGCCDFCEAEPLQILKRGIFPGDLVSTPWLNTSVRVTSELLTTSAPTNLVGADRNTYYVIVFNRLPNSVQTIDPLADEILKFNTPTGVDWVNGTINNNLLYTKTIPSTDFKLIDFEDSSAVFPNNTDIGLANSGWQISMDGKVSAVHGTGQIPDSAFAAGWSANSINYNIAGSGGSGTGGIPVSTSTGFIVAGPNNSCMSYLVTNKIHFGGYAIVFNITRLMLASRDSTAIITPGNWTAVNLSGPGSVNLQSSYRVGLANSTWFSGSTPPDRNNIGLSYVSNAKSILTTTDECNFAGPIAPFKISVGDTLALTHLPVLTLIKNADW
jgi:hypothetical protein